MRRRVRENHPEVGHSAHSAKPLDARENQRAAGAANRDSSTCVQSFNVAGEGKSPCLPINQSYQVPNIGQGLDLRVLKFDAELPFDGDDQADMSQAVPLLNILGSRVALVMERSSRLKTSSMISLIRSKVVSAVVAIGCLGEG